MNWRARVRAADKWRPSVGLIVALVLAIALALPFAGLFIFRIYENQLVHQTESELIGQSTVLAVLMRRAIEAYPTTNVALGPEVTPSPSDPEAPLQPMLPALDLARDSVLGRRPDADPAPAPADPAYVAIGTQLAPDLVQIKKTTLAGFRLLDPKGVVIAGGEETGLSLAHVEEVDQALRGHYQSAMRLRLSRHSPPPLYTLSRGTSIRVFVALPVIVHGRVGGVVYASRTPSNIFKSLYAERNKVAAAGATIATLALLIGLVFQRTITRPMKELMARTVAIAQGDRAALAPLAHHGTAELAELSKSFLDMATSLQNRSDFIATFAAHVSHELKSPLTAIQGAAELLRDDLETPEGNMNPTARRRFLDNIIADTGRLTTIVQRLRELARAEVAPIGGETNLMTSVADLRGAFAGLKIEAKGELSIRIDMSAENIRIVLAHLADNSWRHGATTLILICRREGKNLQVIARDDGQGISRANRERIFESFFTTRREDGGTGMGLAIARAVMEAHGGSIAYLADDTDPPSGAAFELFIPLADP
jgi:signal transduction histidine kinase